MSKQLVVLLLLILPGVSFSQSGGPTDMAALRDIEKHRWERAMFRLRKTLARDTLNPSVRYGLSLFYFAAENPRYHLDSAYHYAITALNDYNSVSLRTREKLGRLAIDSARLVLLRAQIDSAAFERARQENTESAYLGFLRRFPSAVQRELAEDLRNEVAYQAVLKENTPEGFRRYVTKYPNASRTEEAQKHYHRLLFYRATSDKRLSSYEKFLEEHPETPYREEAFRNIFEISTAGGEIESFLSFISRYPSNKFAKRSRQFVFYLLEDEEQAVWPDNFLTDSLRALHALNQAVLIPFFRDGRYGFMDERGRVIIPVKFAQIVDEYLCGNIRADVLIADNRLVTRDGIPICQRPIASLNDLDDLGSGFVMITNDSGAAVIHKSGFVLQDSVQDARVLNKRFVAVKKHDRWLLYALTGRLIDQRSWDDISLLQGVLVLSKDRKKFLTPISEIARSVEAAALSVSAPFDEVKPWQGSLIWGKSGEFEGVLNDRLESIIRFDQHVLTQTFFGAAARLPNGIALYNHTGRKSASFEDVRILGDRVAVRKNRSWSFFNTAELTPAGESYDSLTSEGPFFISVAADTLTVHFAAGIQKSFFRPRKISFVPGMDSISFLVVEHQTNTKTVFDLAGKRLFAGSFQAIEYAGQHTFVVSNRGRKGLVNSKGQRLLPVEFDAIGSAQGQVVTVLRNRKFGAYNIGSRKFIKPAYDRNPVAYTQGVFVAFKDGYHGLIEWDNKPVSRFEFDEINYWNDSVALVRQGSYWNLYDLYAQKALETNLRSVKMVRESSSEKIAIVQKGNEFGVISNRGNEIIPITFSKVINVGSPNVPLFFTEKDIPEAALQVVIYYDATGQMLRKEIYDNGWDYDKIYCSDQ